jgi:hypothetical protein
MALEAMGSERVSVTFSVRMGARMGSNRPLADLNSSFFLNADGAAESSVTALLYLAVTGSGWSTSSDEAVWFAN